jgi:hypothetical protein
MSRADELRTAPPIAGGGVGEVRMAVLLPGVEPLFVLLLAELPP